MPLTLFIPMPHYVCIHRVRLCRGQAMLEAPRAQLLSPRYPPHRLVLPLSPQARWLAAADCCQITTFWSCSMYHLPYAFVEWIIDPTFPHCL